VEAVRRDRSEEAFRILYERHTPRAVQLAYRILGGIDQDAEDAVQEAWLRAVDSLGSWRADAPFGSWLNGIAAHVAFDVLRRNGRFTSDDQDVGATPDPLHDRIDLEGAIRALPPGYRAVLVLHDIEGFSHDEIGSALGISAGTSRGQLFKAHRAMRALLKCESTWST